MKINGLPTLVFPSENERGNMSKQDITKLDLQTLQFATHIAGYSLDARTVDMLDNGKERIYDGFKEFDWKN